MATLVDSLILSLSLDSTKFTKGAKEVQQSHKKLKESVVADSKDVELAAAKAADGVNRLAKEFAGLFVLFTAGKGIKNFVADLTAGDAAIGRFAGTVGMSSKELQGWQGAIESVGGSAGDTASDIRMLSDQLQGLALSGDSSKLATIGKIQALSGKRINLQANPAEQLKQYNVALHELYKKNPAAEGYLSRQLGITNADNQLLIMAPERVNRLRMEFEKYAASDKDIAAAEKRQDLWAILIKQSESLGRTILTALTPAFVQIGESIRDFMDKHGEALKKWIVDVAGVMVEWKGTILTIVGIKFAAWLTGLISPIIAFGSASKIALAPWLVFFAAFEGFQNLFERFWHSMGGSGLEALGRLFGSGGNPAEGWEGVPGGFGGASGGRKGGGKGGEAGEEEGGAGGGGKKGAGEYNVAKAYKLIKDAGGTDEEARMLAAISQPESQGNPKAHNTNAGTGDNSYGLWQINMLGAMGPERRKKYGLKSNDDLLDPATNARVALQMARDAHGYRDWSTYKAGKHIPYLAKAGEMPAASASPSTNSGKFVGTPWNHQIESAPKPAPATPPAPSPQAAPTPPAGKADAVAFGEQLEGMKDHDPAGHAKIMDFLSGGGGKMDPATRDWCARFVGSALKKSGYQGSLSDVATSYLNVGHPFTGLPKRDDIIVTPRGRSAGGTGGHVSIATGNVDTKNQTFEVIEGDIRVNHNNEREGHMVRKEWENLADLRKDPRRKDALVGRRLPPPSTNYGPQQPTREHPDTSYGPQLPDKAKPSPSWWDSIKKGYHNIFGANVGAHLAAATRLAQNPGHTNSHNKISSETNVGDVHVHVGHGADAHEIARNIKPALERTKYAMQHNYSLA